MKAMSTLVKFVLTLAFSLMIVLIVMLFFNAFNPRYESGGWVVVLVRAIGELIKPRV